MGVPFGDSCAHRAIEEEPIGGLLEALLKQDRSQGSRAVATRSPTGPRIRSVRVLAALALLAACEASTTEVRMAALENCRESCRSEDLGA